MRLATSSRRAASVAVLAAASVLAACGDDSGDDADPASTTTTVAAPLSAEQLEELVVGPVGFEQASDSAMNTGLMEVGHPDSGVIGVGYAEEDALVAAGLQRGWEKFFTAPDDSFAVVSLLQFDSAEGPRAMVDLFDADAEGDGEPFEIAAVPDAHAIAGTSPEGRDFVGVAFAKDRFLLTILGGGPPGARDYRSIFTGHVAAQVARLP